jgi:hypothetical protein
MEISYTKKSIQVSGWTSREEWVLRGDMGPVRISTNKAGNKRLNFSIDLREQVEKRVRLLMEKRKKQARIEVIKSQVQTEGVEKEREWDEKRTNLGAQIDALNAQYDVVTEEMTNWRWNGFVERVEELMKAEGL